MIRAIGAEIEKDPSQLEKHDQRRAQLKIIWVKACFLMN